jgi:hypothetical protein
MATKKKLLQAAAGTAAAGGGAGALNVEDVFSTYLYEGNGSSQVIENGINLGQSNSGGGIYFPDGDGDYLQTATLPALSGEFTIELWFYSYDLDRAIYLIGNGSDENNFVVKTDYLSSSGLVYITVAGTSVNGNASSYYDIDGWNHLAITRNSSNVVSSYVNGSRIGTATISGNLNSTTYNIGAVGGGTVSASGYELMYGYMSSVRISDTARYDPTSTSLTVPTSAFTSDSNTVLLVGQGDTPLADASSNSYSVTVNGNPRASEVGPFDAADAGEGGLVVFKNRNTTDDWHTYDTERGTGKRIALNTTTAEYSGSSTYGLTSFNANGFSVGTTGAVNNNGSDLASWTFRKAPKFFDVVTYTGTGSAQTIAHNLGTTVGTIIVKRTDSTADWAVYHRSTGATDVLTLNSTAAASTDGSRWNNTEPTSTVFTVGSDVTTNENTRTYVAYLFAHNDGDGEFGPDADADIIKCGSFTGNGSSDGPEIDLGFEPQWVLLKDATNGSTNWNMHDNMRGISVGGADAILYANQNFAENASIARMDITPTGFKMTTSTTGWNASSANMIYIAIRRGPMAVPTDATEVFAATDMSSSYLANTGFPVDLSIDSSRTNTSSNYVNDRLRGSGAFLTTDSTAAETSGGTRHFDSNDGVIYTTGFTGINWSWKRAPSYFDVVAYTGNGTAGRTVSHNLGVAPEMMWVKKRAGGTGAWPVYHVGAHSTSPENYFLQLNSTITATLNSARWNNTAPTATEFTVGDGGTVNDPSDTYIAYLFASVDGVSKVGSINHISGVDTNVDCGFSNGARFVLWKQTDASNSWGVVDVERGLVSGNDALLLLNSTNAETSVYDLIDPLSSGFVFTGTFGTGSYIFYAIA